MNAGGPGPASGVLVGYSPWLMDDGHNGQAELRNAAQCRAHFHCSPE